MPKFHKILKSFIGGVYYKREAKNLGYFFSFPIKAIFKNLKNLHVIFWRSDQGQILWPKL